MELAEWIAAECRALGLARAAIVNGVVPQRLRAYKQWISERLHGEMQYLEDPAHVTARADPTMVLPDVKSAIVVALAYERDPTSPPQGHGQIARYARGDDYHIVLRDALVQLAKGLREKLGLSFACRTCIDSAPVLDRDFAEQAGLGFIGKNSMLIVPSLGSYVVLGALWLDIELPTSAPRTVDTRCGSCTSCLDACPTNAFVGDYVLDARRCISYLTIEFQGVIPRDLRGPIGTWIFGCDICQTACPFNHGKGQPQLVTLKRRSHQHAFPDLATLALAPSNQLRNFVQRTALRRSGRAQLLRNVAIALGNCGQPESVAPLAHLLAHRQELVRLHAAWGLGALVRILPQERHRIEELLRMQLACETDLAVVQELHWALAGAPNEIT